MDKKRILTPEEMQKNLFDKCGIEIDKAEGDNSPINSDDLIPYVPMEYPVDGDDCRFVLSTDVIDGRQTFIVSYERPSDNYVCMTITGDSLFDVLYNTLIETCSDD